MLCPRIAFGFPSFVYFPSLGPSTIAPASASHPPTECTTVDPAKSWNPLAASQLSLSVSSRFPHAHEPNTG
jgi:hypothetical protein